MRNFHLLWAIPATAAVGAIWCVSAYANYSFGLSLGSDLFGYASLAVDVAKAVMLFGAFAALAHRQFLVFLTLAAIWACCSIWGIASAIGFVSTHYATMTDNRGKTQEEWAGLEEQIANLRERRKTVASARPEGVVQSELDGLLRDAGSCAIINGPVTRSLCPKIDKLKAELANAQSATWIDGRLDALRKEMKTAVHVSSVDPRADMLAGLLGMASPALAKGLAGFFALMMELITATGLWAVWKAFGGTLSASQAKKEEIPVILPSEKVGQRSPREPMKALERISGAKLPALTGDTMAWEEDKPEDHSSVLPSKPEELPVFSPDRAGSRSVENAQPEHTKTVSDEPVFSPVVASSATTDHFPDVTQKVSDTENLVAFPGVDLAAAHRAEKDKRAGRMAMAKKNLSAGPKNDHHRHIIAWMGEATTQVPRKADGTDKDAPYAKDAYEYGFKPWCLSRGILPAGPKAFSRIIAGELDLPHSKAGKRSAGSRQLLGMRYSTAVPSRKAIA